MMKNETRMEKNKSRAQERRARRPPGWEDGVAGCVEAGIPGAVSRSGISIQRKLLPWIIRRFLVQLLVFRRVYSEVKWRHYEILSLPCRHCSWCCHDACAVHGSDPISADPGPGVSRGCPSQGSNSSAHLDAGPARGRGPDSACSERILQGSRQSFPGDLPDALLLLLRSRSWPHQSAELF